MDDLISRQAAIDAVHRSEALDRAFGYGHAVDALRELPPAQPERIKGRWVLVTDNNGQHFECNHCGEWRYHQEQKFCGECGAEMEVTE